MNDVRGVGRLENVEERVRNDDHLRKGQLLFIPRGSLLQRLTFEQRHDQEDVPIVGHVVVDRGDDTGVVHTVREERLPMR
ncbi:hypothetical protein LZC94_15850 [Pendulispora albinea]|uniref:Uncharacterized protein n=1 Tax=Pendulispora albinea TaxID=2741071 RepID=A0ABZ2M859_9BACT